MSLRSTIVPFVLALALTGCDPEVGPGPAARPEGPAVAINVAALNLAGVGDVVWDLEVVSGAGTAQTVWQRRIASSRYGDGAGSASYVGPCDADANPNVVRVWVVGVYASGVTSLGAFNSGSTDGVGAVTGTPVPFQNPTTTAVPLTRSVTCQQNADVPVQFDVALMRPAQQGFFDIAVNFNNIFCSAKFDCCEDDNNNGCEAGEDFKLLFDAAGARSSTMVLGFACTAGARTDVETELYLDALALDCTSPTAGSFNADVLLNPSGAAGNQCTAGTNGMGGCTGVVSELALGTVDADTYLYQLGVYRGVEDLTSGGVDAQKVYWNVALGVKRPAIGGCWLKTRGTADDGLGSGLVDAGVISAGTVYPYVQWEVNLGTCGSEPLTFGAPAAMVRPAYTGTGDDALRFGYAFGPSLPAGPLCAAPCQNNGQCVAGSCQCLAGFTGSACETNINECSPNPCQNGGVCTDGVNTFSCACVGGYSGDQCETPSGPDGSSAAQAIASCDALHTANPAAPSGSYWVDPDGDGVGVAAFYGYCEMAADGGWTLVLRGGSDPPTQANWVTTAAYNVAAAASDGTQTGPTFKLADATNNALGGIYRVKTAGSYVHTRYLPSTCVYVHTSTPSAPCRYTCSDVGLTSCMQGATSAYGFGMTGGEGTAGHGCGLQYFATSSHSSYMNGPSASYNMYWIVQVAGTGADNATCAYGPGQRWLDNSNSRANSTLTVWRR